MFAGLNPRQTKTASASDRKVKADAAHNTKNANNSVWQSLATRTTGLQAKLTVSQPNDPHELEADRLADRIMRMETPSSHAGRLSFSSFNGSTAQRKCDRCDDEGKQVQRKENGVGSNPVDVAASSISHTLSATGQPLDSSSRSFFEPHFGRDFGDVRIHTDAKAAESARAVNARAYTVGQNIVFGAGQYGPSTGSGRHLLAHELSHVCQQTNPVRAGEAIMSDRPASRLSGVTNTLQRQTGDPLTDPFGEGKKEETKPKLDPKTEKLYKECPNLCQKFPPVEVVPNVFVAMCDDSVLMRGPDVRTVGCSPNRQGKIGFFAGAPAWQLPAQATSNFSGCNAPDAKAGASAGIKIGYIQTVQECLSGGVYFKKDASGKWVWAGNKWCCVKNARDGMVNSVEPWYGEKGTLGPQPLEGTWPSMADTPNITLDARQDTTQIDRGVEGGGNPLRRLRIDGIFHLWLVAKPPKGPLVFIHHWSIQCWVVAVLPDDADPCNVTQWQKMNMNKVITSGPGKGSATPVLTGDVANVKVQDCSAPSPTGDAASKDKKSCNIEKKPTKAGS